MFNNESSILELFCYSKDIFTDFPADRCLVLKGLITDCLDCPRYEICKKDYTEAYKNKLKANDSNYQVKSMAISALTLAGFCTDKNFERKAEKFWELFSENIGGGY